MKAREMYAVAWHAVRRQAVEIEISPRSAEIVVGLGCGQAGMAGLAERLKIVFVVRSTLIDGDFMVNFSGGNESASNFTEFAKRVPADVQVPNVTPAATIDAV